MDYKEFSENLVEFLDTYYDDTMSVFESINAERNQDCGLYCCIIGLLMYSRDHNVGCPSYYLYDKTGKEIPAELGIKKYKDDLKNLIDLFIEIYEEANSYDGVDTQYHKAMKELTRLLPCLWS